MQAVGLLFMPESPIWLSWKGRSAAALQAEHKLLGAAAETEGEVAERRAPVAGGREDEAMANGSCNHPEQQVCHACHSHPDPGLCGPSYVASMYVK